MKKKLLTAAIAAAMIAPLAAQASGPTVYGVAHVAIESVDWDADAVSPQDGNGNDNSRAGDYWRVVSRQSRVGVKGTEDLGNGLKAIYKMEWQVDLAEDSNTGAEAGQDRTSNNLHARNQYVGLSGNWGTFLAGRHDSPVKMMTISRDMFNTTLGDWNEVGGRVTGVANPTDDRINNAIMYISPNFNGVTVAALVSPGEQDNDDDGINDETTAIAAKYVNGPIYLALGYQEREAQGDEADTGVASTSDDDQEIWRIAGSYTFGDFTVGGMYEDQESADRNWSAAGNGGAGDGVDGEVWVVNASYSFGNSKVKVQYQEGEEDHRIDNVSDNEYESVSIGVDHNFSKRTRIYAVYTDTDADTTSADGTTETDNDHDAFGVGLIHKF